MSGIAKKIGKVFKKIVKSKIVKVVLIAAAVYFTAGVALAAGGSAFAASLPGITAAGQAVGLSGVGAIAATGAEVGAAALSSAAVLGGTAEGGGGALLGMSGVGGANTVAGAAGASLAGEAAIDVLGATAEGGGGALSGMSGVGGANTVAGGATSSVGAGGLNAADALGGSAEGGGGAFKGLSGSGGANTGLSGAWDKFSMWAEKNPVVAKAAMTFGSDGIKAGFNAYAAKSQQDAAEERYQQDREDRTRREAVPALYKPTPQGKYNAGLVNQVAGLDEEKKA